MLKLSNSLIGVTGEYFVCAELGKRGILGLITPRNNPLFDIVASTPDGKRSITIQVKTMSSENNQGWKLGKDICVIHNNDNLYVVLVNIRGDNNDYFIYKYDDLAKRVEELYNRYISTPKKDGSPKKEVAFRWFDFKDFKDEDWNRKNNWSVLGF